MFIGLVCASGTIRWKSDQYEVGLTQIWFQTEIIKLVGQGLDPTRSLSCLRQSRNSVGKYSKYLRLSFASQRVVLTSDRILERLNTNRFSRFESPVTNHPSVDDIQQFNFSVRHGETMIWAECEHGPANQDA